MVEFYTQDNCSIDWTFVVDNEDNSVARCREYIRLLIKLAGLEIVMETLQTDFPQELYPVTTFAIGVPIFPKDHDLSIIGEIQNQFDIPARVKCCRKCMP